MAIKNQPHTTQEQINRRDLSAKDRPSNIAHLILPTGYCLPDIDRTAARQIPK
ncbi:MAG: hypothetical protein LBF88_02260 [Planctomycetaceae bacterium]|jgi:hypothetical protein|nr:hypothetical protein [Planctomycetaceae bacterium]